MATKQQLLALARADYQPDLAAVDPTAIETLQLPEAPLGLMASGLLDHPAGATPKLAAAYLLALNSQNFMFWSPGFEEGFTRYQFGGQSGALGMRAAFDLAWGDVGTPVGLRQRFAPASSAAVVDLFGFISLPPVRMAHLNEVLHGHDLEDAALELVRAAQTGRLTTDDAARIATRFPVAYSDPYLKRAQLAVMWFAGYLAELGAPVELDLTVASDYQLPRVMRALGVLRYSPPLADLVDRKRLIGSGSVEERAIRAATILGAQSMAEHLGVSEPAIDNYLWQYRKSCGETPHHLTVTADY